MRDFDPDPDFDGDRMTVQKLPLQSRLVGTVYLFRSTDADV